MSIFLPSQSLRYEHPRTTAASGANVSHIIGRSLTLRKDSREGSQALSVYIPSPPENEPASHGVPYSTALRVTTQPLSYFAESHQRNCTLRSVTFHIYPPASTDAPNLAFPLNKPDSPFAENGTVLLTHVGERFETVVPLGTVKARVVDTDCSCDSWMKRSIHARTSIVSLGLEQHIFVDDNAVADHFGAQSGSKYMGAKNWDIRSPRPQLEILSLGSQNWQVRADEKRMKDIVEHILGAEG